MDYLSCGPVVKSTTTRMEILSTEMLPLCTSNCGVPRLTSLTDVINLLGLPRRKIGKALGKTIKVSAVGVYSFDGANEQQKQVGKG